MSSKLTFRLVSIEEINADQRERMFQLMTENYDAVTESNFYHDLATKQWVGLIQDECDTIQGFTTFAIDPEGVGQSSYHVIFSGDTVIAPEHWGSQVMMKGWCTSVGRFIGSDPGKPWYWYLLSKGHRTYMYLHLFFKQFYPSVSPAHMETELKSIAAELSRRFYPKYWREDEGVIRFDESKGELRPDLADATIQKKNNSVVQFFLKKNPNFYKGEELVCVALISPDNMLRSAKDLVIEGMRDPIKLQVPEN